MKKTTDWEISPEDKNRLATHKLNVDTNKKVGAIAESISKVGAQIKKSTDDSNSNILKSMKSQFSMFKSMYDQMELLVNKPQPDWTFDVKRNKDGFISKVFAKKV